MRFKIGVVLSLLFCVTPAMAQTGNDAWRAFRDAYPYHIQTTAITDPAADGSRTLIISEPPPHVTIPGLIELNSKVLSNPVTPKHKVGYDGWVKDIVFTLPPMRDSELHEVLDRIHHYLFATTYKSSALHLPAKRSSASGLPLDVRVTSNDISRWFIQGSATFHNDDTGSLSVKQLLEQKRSGVFFSDEPGIVAWVLPRGGSYSGVRREARQFALDSDVIVGAIAAQTHLAIIGRERIIPPDVLPPLRVETILQLADQRGDSLEQSYERNYLLAGKYDQEHDWAPIYLSNALVDSEYGSLLNLTDQLLKSWSLAGQVKYIDFPYPDPHSYPFDKPLALLPQIKKGMAEGEGGLTFNWNTKGAGYVDSVGAVRIYALNRTGALPISYMSGTLNTGNYENSAYSWFAEKTSDPNLARVVQYAALYQIFHEFRIHGDPATSPVNKQPNTARVADAVAVALRTLRQKECNEAALPDHTQAARELHRLMQLLQAGALEHSCELLGDLALEYGDDGIVTLAAVLASGERSDADSKLLKSVYSQPVERRDAFADSLPVEKRRRLDALIYADELGEDPSFRFAIEKKIPLSKARDLFVAGSARPESGWIRTASIVVSWPLGELAELSGGHNLYARVGRFVQDDLLKTGEIRVTREGADRVIHYSAADRSHLTEWLRTEAVEKDDTTVAKAIKATISKPPEVPPNRSLPAALSFSRGRTERGLTTQLASLGGFEMPTGLANRIELTERETVLSQSLKNKSLRVLSVERQGNGSYRFFQPQTGRIYQTDSITDVLDNVVASLKRSPGKPPTTLTLAGFDQNGAIDFRHTVETWLAGEDVADARFPVTLASDRDKIPSFEPLSSFGDLQRATFGDWRISDITLESGKTGQVFEATIEVPARATGLRGFILRIRLFFRNIFPSRQQLAGAQTGILGVLAKLPGDATAGHASAALETALRIRFPKLDRVALEVMDVTIVENQPVHNYANRPAD